MPKGEPFWNPYRWVTVSDQAVQHDVPAYHHCLSGLSGRLKCDLEALTPLFIGSGSKTGEFVRHAHSQQPLIPATSLKGAIRSLAEVVGNAAVPFSKTYVDEQHRLAKARKGQQLDIVARMFGYLDRGDVFAGLVCFSDAELIESSIPPDQWPSCKVAVGQPKQTHKAFYPKNNRRKFYHHDPDAKQLAKPDPGIRQTARVRPAPPGTRFRFTVNFENLRDEELNLLLYCLALEEQATVTLSPDALDRSSDQDGETLCGPLRHKLGGAKPHGAGSARIRITTLELRAEPAARYRGNAAPSTYEKDQLEKELARRTNQFRERTDRTMAELRAMLVYVADDPSDPRTPRRYPTFPWFRNNSQIPLKPTI